MDIVYKIHDTIAMSPDELREQIELEIVELLQRKMESFEIQEARAKQIAQRVLDVLRIGMTFEELYRAIPLLDDSMPELAPVVLPHVRDYEMNVTNQALAQVQHLIRQGQFDAATQLAKKAASRDIELIWTGSGKKDP